jgi:Tfp pilus assembly protein PilN
MLLTAPFGSSEKGEIYAANVRELDEINSRLYQLESKEIELKRFNGWKDFYKNTYTNQPAWSKMFSSLAKTIPEGFVLNSFELFPGKKTGIHGWSCALSGQINATQWNNGLALLREFGTKIHQSQYFEIVDVQYTPLEEDNTTGSEKISFEFVIKMKLSPQENK